MSTELASRIAAEHAAAADSLPAGVVAPARRRRAIDALLACGLPTSRDENWRYANLRLLERVRFTPSGTQAAPAPAELPAAIDGFARYVFVDGVLSQPASPAASPRAGLRIHAPGDPAEELASGPWGPPSTESAFALLNEAFALDCARIDVSATDPPAAAPACVEVVFLARTPAQTGTSYPRLRVHVAPHTGLRLIERHVSLADEPASFVNAAVEVHVEAGARVDHFRLEQLGARAGWMDTLTVGIGSSGAYQLHTMALGAAAARSTVRVRLEGEGAQLAMHSLAVGDRQQVLDTHAIVEHAAAHTRTEQRFRGIAAGRSRVAFNGKIIVRPNAHGTDSTQSLRGLLAGERAEIDVRPQLEIYTDDVRCSHGATTGKLDETMLFYLLSRGLDPATAQRLLKWAFLEDVISRIDVAPLRRQIETHLAAQMQEEDALKELL